MVIEFKCHTLDNNIIGEIMEYTKGSEWRRWDLHIHTPETKKNDQFEGHTPQEKWDKFYQDIISYIDSDEINHKVAVLGITDYFSVENYRKVISDKQITDKFDLIVPNIELRITPVSNESPINIHFICNPAIVSQLNTKLFAQLKYVHTNGIPYYATTEDFIKLGKLNDKNLNDIQAYQKGLEQFVVDFTSLKELLNQDKELKENTIVAVSNKSTDGVSGLGNTSCRNANSALTMLREDIYCFSDIIFSANQSDVDYFLGKKEGIPREKIIEKYGKLLPCVHGCDAHSNSKILKPDNNKFCWIKADCTFEGLKQITYEPAERVRIMAHNPNVKKDYNIIDKIIISDEKFSSKPIEFNPNLTCFIGGKSTGKSIVLNNMASKIDHDQYASKFKGNEFIIQNLIVYWKDGYINDGITNSRHIVYIPQTYLNRLSDEQEEKTEIDDIIQSIVLQDTEINEKYQEFTASLADQKSVLDKEILDLLAANQAKCSYNEQLTENGRPDTISKELQKLQGERDKLTKTLQISNQELEEYDALKVKITDLGEKINSLRQDCKTINDMTLSIYCDEEAKLSEETNKIFETFVNEKNKVLTEAWEKEKNTLVSNLEKEASKIESELAPCKKSLAEKEKVIETTEILKQLNKNIKAEEERLARAKNLTDIIEKQTEIFNGLVDKLIHKISIFDAIHQEFAAYVNEKTNGFDESMKFIANAPFRLEQFDKKVRTIYNNKKLKSIYPVSDNSCAEDIDENIIAGLVKPLFSFDGQTLLKSGISIEEALRAVLSNWYNITYTIELDNDTIKTMSPGKKALVLLKLLINLADADCPILIDQPEDDLDNRSIYDELVTFIRHKKYDRQIIIVTHNANIVVGSDAEEIIVANQQGANSPNEHFRFEYRSGSIENNSILYDTADNIRPGILNRKGIQGHICEILEGGKEAFNVRKNKYTLV